jgi:hypothetical protein
MPKSELKLTSGTAMASMPSFGISFGTSFGAETGTGMGEGAGGAALVTVIRSAGSHMLAPVMPQ